MRHSPLPRPRHTRPAVAVTWGLILLASATCAQAQWTWRDAAGRVTASDRPPPREVPDKDILSRPNTARRSAAAAAAAAVPAASAADAAASSAAASAKTPLDRELEARKRAAEQELATKAKVEEERVAQLRADNCRRARSQQTTLESGQRLTRVNDKGEREVIDEKVRADEMKRARDVIASDCR